MAKTYVVTFRSYNDDRPSKFIVVANNMRAAINIAWEKGGGRTFMFGLISPVDKPRK